MSKDENPDVPITPAKRMPPSPGTVSAKPRHFEFVSGTSNKFWEVSQDGSNMTTRWGRIGSAGQSKTKTFADPQAAAAAMAKLIAEKTDEGYVEH